MTLDHDIFLALNFDGGEAFDRAMLAVSGNLFWIPLYILILFIVWRRGGWRGVGLFLLLVAAAVGLSDVVAGIFKANGLLGSLMTSFEPRWRPMFTPSLEGLDITPDSLMSLRRMTAEEAAAAGILCDWQVHVPVEAVAGRYGTVSAHAATAVALAVMSVAVIRRRWFTVLMVAATVVICYSRIYLAKHFPMDLLWGSLLGGALGYAAYRVYRRLFRLTADRGQAE